MKLRRVVVTGLGALTPIGNNLAEYWQGLIDGVSGADLITKFDASKFKTRFACEVKNFDVNQFMDRKEARKHDPYSQFGMVSAHEAYLDANLENVNLDLDRAGVIWASGIGGIQTYQEELTSFVQGDGTPRFNPFFIPKMISDICAGHISIRYGFRGPNFATVSACASSANAIADAINYIRLGKADIFICGGSEAAVTIMGVGGFNAMHALSARNDDYKTASRPFDKDRDGFVIGEGAGALIVEDLDHALKRGAKIYCEIVGAGLSADAYHMTATHPEGLGAKKAMQEAINDAGLSLEDVDHINTHGTSTPVGDPSEAKAIQDLFGDYAKNIYVNSTKSMTGHLLGAAGAIEAIATILAINKGIIPPTINHFTDDPEIAPLNFVFNEARKAVVNVALSNTFGFGGHNVSVAFKKYQ
ncbi:MAG: beta-ketoacyl-ACP synthase II [Bacteroidales bacterium]|jgi:3-oxoacyl-[acyl-carrier-protein] synthase II|nr:beta-ketoacyl-ACP synthase II [Bacteroidales bacterium]